MELNYLAGTLSRMKENKQMPVSRRELIAYGTAGALTAMSKGMPAISRGAAQSAPVSAQVPMQVATDRSSPPALSRLSGYDMRDHLNPRRLTIAMWDVAYALRHQPGGSFADYDRVLDEAVERG